MDFNGDTSNVTRESIQEILQFLKVATEIFSPNLESSMASTPALNSLNINTTYTSGDLNKLDLEEVLIHDCNFKNRAGIFVKVIFDYIVKHTDTFNKDNYSEILNYSKEIGNFLKACEPKNIVDIKPSISKFLNQLFEVLKNIDNNDFLTKGPLYQFVARIIHSFKEVKSAQNEILISIEAELTRNFESIKNGSLNNVDKISYESLLLYLTILREILDCKGQSVFGAGSLQENGDTMANIKNNLMQMGPRLPAYFADILKECIHLL